MLHSKIHRRDGRIDRQTDIGVTYNADIMTHFQRIAVGLKSSDNNIADSERPNITRSTKNPNSKPAALPCLTLRIVGTTDATQDASQSQ